MGRVLVVSRNPGMAMGLSATEHDVVDIRPTAFDSWVDDSRNEQLDGVVLDVTDADAALHAITELRAHAQMAPVLVVPGDGPGWDDARMRDLPAAAMLPRPVTKPALQEAVDRLVALGTESLLTTPATASPADSDADGASDDSAVDTEATDGAATPPLAVVAPLDLPSDQTLASGDEISALLDRLTAAPSVTPAPHGAVVSFEAPVSVRAPEVVAPPSPAPPSALELVRSLLRVTQDLYGVNETADAVVRDALERTGAEAGALLLPDGTRWRVAAGVGLRPLEYRIELTPDDWLIMEVAQGQRSIVMEDTDIVRQPLRGSPLANWHHLVATPVPTVDGVLLIAREGDTAFTEGDVELLAALTNEASPLIASSIEVRTLARRIEHLRELGDPHAARL